MSDHRALLPSGLRDLLPPEAETEAAAVERLMASFAAHGYQRVKPPLIEFEDSLLAGSGAAMGDQTFRLMDPDTRRMMGLRADMTPQIARIATTRLAASPRPLRLSYAGQVLRVQASQIAPDRQIPQAGIELIGHDSPEADAEIVLVGAEALRSLGIARLSIDLTMPTLVPSLLDETDFATDRRAALTRALDRKDIAAVRERAGPLAATLSELLLAAGPADGALVALAAADLPPATRVLADRIAATVAAIRARFMAGVTITVDPVEFRGLKYHTGVCMTVYTPDRRAELGRGGRYICGETEAATGLTLYPDAILQAVPPVAAPGRVFIPFGADAGLAAALRAEGFITIAALDADASPRGCTHILSGDGTAAPLSE
ncbi:MAG: ATP phosphoribosyltransferase regulatory subunit [Sandarakinorhabdus sp.]|nr:ATP phosphoribosyltransferase regulatory subunit [Sandarakinorhabdus sp.]